MTAISGRLSKPLEPRPAGALVLIARTAAELGVDFVVVGAMARDIHFEHIWGIFTRRRTGDIDLAVQVKDWAQYERLRQGLESSRFFASVQGMPERFLADNGALIDILPFGGLASPGEVIAWPKEKRTMSVTGVGDVFTHALTLSIPDSHGAADVRIASIPGLVILKLVALSDSKGRAGKDADDIEFIISNYLAVGNRSRVGKGPDGDLIRMEPFDLLLVSARLLGRDMARMSSKPTRVRVGDILRRESAGSGNNPLADELAHRLHGDALRVRQLLAALLQGYEEGSREQANRA